jgi:hypothetical protein
VRGDQAVRGAGQIVNAAPLTVLAAGQAEALVGTIESLSRTNSMGPWVFVSLLVKSVSKACLIPRSLLFCEDGVPAIQKARRTP